MEGVPESVALLLVLAFGLLGRVVRIETFRLGLVQSCGGHDCLDVEVCCEIVGRGHKLDRESDERNKGC